MPTAWDRNKLSVGDYDPTRNLLDFESIHDTVQRVGNPIAALFNGLGAGFANIISALQGIDLGQAGAVVSMMLAKIQELIDGLIQWIIDAIVNALTGGSSTGNDVSAVLWALNPLNWLQQGAGAIQRFLDPFLAQMAGLEGRLTAAEAALFNTGNPLQYDSFNRSDIGPWTSVTAIPLSITGNSRIQVQAGLAAGYIGTAGDVREPLSDQHGVHIKLVNQWDGVCRAIICSNDTLTNYAAIEIHSSLLGTDSIRVVTGSSPSVVVAHTRVDFGPGWLGQGLSNGTVLSFWYDQALNTFFVARNSQVIDELAFPDTSNLVLHGPTKRKVGLASNCTNLFGHTGFGITDFTYYDKT